MRTSVIFILGQKSSNIIPAHPELQRDSSFESDTWQWRKGSSKALQWEWFDIFKRNSCL